MTIRAYLVGAAGASAVDAVGGLSIVLRQVLSLQEAGVHELFVVGASAVALRCDTRVSARVEEAPHQPPGADRSAIVSPTDVVFHPSVVKRLARMAIPDDSAIAVGDGDAVIYLCGANRAATAAAAVGAGRRVDAVSAPLEPGEFVVAVRTNGDRRRATALLLRSLEKPSDGLASRYLHRRISRVVTRWLLPYSVTPNMMTLGAALFGVAGVIVAYPGGYWRVLAGALLFEVQNILDGCDGEIARLKFQRSRGGEWLDQVIDDVLNIAFLMSIGGALAHRDVRYAWPVAVVALVAQVVHVIGLYAGLLVKAGGRGSVARLRWWVGSGEGRSLLGDLTRRDILALAYLVSALAGEVVVVFLWHAALTIGSAAVTTLQWFVWGGPGTQADGAADGAGSAAA